MEGLVDYVKRQVKCPECRAEHRVPYNGIQGFPTNITLTKFLELHADITGELPDPNADAIMSRCNVALKRHTSTHVLIVTRRFVMTVKKLIATSLKEKSPESTIRSKEGFTDWRNV